MQGCKHVSYVDRLGLWGVARVVWKAIPWQFRVFAFLHFLSVYRRLFKICTSLDEVRCMHTDYYHKFRVFRLYRPRFHVIKKALLPLDLTPSDVAVREAAQKVRPVAWIPSETKAPSIPIIPV
jgi:hypothetical protein